MSAMLPRRTTRTMGILFAASFLCSAAPTGAQVFDLDKDREPVVLLDGLWRFHPGDDPRWADPSFDDSQWPLISSAKSWNDQGYPNLSGMAWYRVKVLVPKGDDSLALLVPRVFTSYQVFANGKLLGGRGGMPPNERAGFSMNAVYPLPPSRGEPRQLYLAFRLWHWPHWASYATGGIQGGVRIGQ